MNFSKYNNESTARTNNESSYQRAEHLAALNVRSVLELCVGPSLKTLEAAYASQQIDVTGNDIDTRWKSYYPQGKWRIGDAMTLPLQGFEAVVFAPPLSRGCSGTRKDSLSIDQVVPTYFTFLKRIKNVAAKVVVLVLPGRSLATHRDREQYFHLLNDVTAAGFQCEAVPLTAGKKQITKYIDLYLKQ